MMLVFSSSNGNVKVSDFVNDSQHHTWIGPPCVIHARATTKTFPISKVSMDNVYSTGMKVYGQMRGVAGL